jgi:hypothetical protein
MLRHKPNLHQYALLQSRGVFDNLLDSEMSRPPAVYARECHYGSVCPMNLVQAVQIATKAVDLVAATDPDSPPTVPHTPPEGNSDRLRSCKEEASSTSLIPYPPKLEKADTDGNRHTGSKTSTADASSRPLSPMKAPFEKREFKDSQELEEALHAVFLQFARFGNRSDGKHLDSFRFMKLCRECCLTTQLGDTRCVDLIFFQVRKVSRSSWISSRVVTSAFIKHHQ